MKFARFTPEEMVHVDTIVSRGQEVLRKAGVPRERLDLTMDLAAVHASCPLRLAELAAAPAFDFSHDIAGIVGRLDRTTGQLRNFFVPRFAVPQG